MEKLSTIYQPVSEELEGVKSIVKCHVMAMQEIRRYIEPYFNCEAKYMRPFLALMSAKMALNGKIDNPTMNKLFDFAAAVELLHTASLVHADSFGDNLYSNEAQNVIIAGDMLYIRAMQILKMSFTSKVARELFEIVGKICCVRLIENKEGGMDKESYNKELNLKTGLLTGFSCLGVHYAAADHIDREFTAGLFNFGVHTGRLYQMAASPADQDTEARESMRRLAVNEAKAFPSSVYKDRLFDLLDYISQYKTVATAVV